MTVRIRLWQIVLVGVPALLALASLVVHDDYWASTNPDDKTPGPLILALTGLLLVGFAVSYTEVARHQLSRSYWHRFHYVKSNPAQATVALWLGRSASIVLLWGLGILGILGRFTP